MIVYSETKVPFVEVNILEDCIWPDGLMTSRFTKMLLKLWRRSIDTSGGVSRSISALSLGVCMSR